MKSAKNKVRWRNFIQAYGSLTFRLVVNVTNGGACVVDISKRCRTIILVPYYELAPVGNMAKRIPSSVCSQAIYIFVWIFLILWNPSGVKSNSHASEYIVSYPKEFVF
jgi:hypothetical protein